ncbi:hypothetical protein LCL97_20120 [Seohaeicola saemankumensis]|nr:AsmA-like C-terminal region-containing protein [Seohaeicola saemankumensis]MCA0873142.1 hypothetical protein [Seohaeicola saemankumensis]
MRKRALNMLIWGVGLLAVLLLCLWAALFLPVFASARASLTERALTDLIGQPLQIRDDARINLGLRVSRVEVSDAVIPSETMRDTDLASLRHLSFDLDMAQLWRGWTDIDDLTIEGLQVNLLRAEDGHTTSWTSAPPDASAPDRTEDQTTEAAPQSGLLSFLRSRRLDVTEVGILYSDARTGFSFDFQLDGLHQARQPTGETRLTGRGSVNTQPFAIDGSYPGDGQFRVAATFADVELGLTGADALDVSAAAVRMALNVSSPDIGDLLDVLQLQRVAEGNGQLSANLLLQPGGLAIDDISVGVALSSGRSVSVTGAIGNVFDLTDLDITADAALFPEAEMPAAAARLEDLKLTGVNARLTSRSGGVAVEKLTVTTNAFDGDLENIGPIRADLVRRTDDGLLRVEGLTVQAGPPEAPVVQATGTIGNLLQFKAVDLTGTLNAPASLLFEKADPETAAALGGLHASFGISDSDGKLNLDRLTARAEGTDLWSLKADMSVGNLTHLARSDLSIDALIADGAKFLTTLGLDAIDTGPVGLNFKLSSQGTEVDTTGAVVVGGSQVDLTLSARKQEHAPVIRGAVESDRIAVDDVADLVAATLALKSLSDGGHDAHAAEKKPEQVEVQPFVLPKGQKQAADSTLVDPTRLLRALDLELAIAIRELTGAAGSTKIDSDLEIEQGTARFGPLKIAYGGGYFNLNAAMDLIETPELIRITGGTGGWDFGKILTRIGVKIAARGTLGARFDLTGRHSSASAFVNSMRGHVTVSMGNGAIATSLLELAGLGVLPWLFSPELQKGYTDIVCIVAPMRISGGKVTSHRIVAESRAVQLVAAGEINWRRDTISLRAEPRPVGKPLHRSAWPVVVSGRLSKPSFQVLAGGTAAHQDRSKFHIKPDRKPCVPDALQVEPRSTRNK